MVKYCINKIIKRFVAVFVKSVSLVVTFSAIQGVHKVSLQLKLLQSEMMRYGNEGCFMLISIS